MTDLSALARHQPLDTAELRLVPLGMEHLDGMLAMLADEESGRLTGTARQFSRAEVEKHLTETVAREDRADWAAIRVADGRFLGEVVLNKLDAGNGVMNLRISLFGTDVLGRGYGTQAINAVVEYGFSRVGCIGSSWACSTSTCGHSGPMRRPASSGKASAGSRM